MYELEKMKSEAQAELDALLIAKTAIERAIQGGCEMENSHLIIKALTLQCEGFNYKIQLARKRIDKLEAIKMPKFSVR